MAPSTGRPGIPRRFLGPAGFSLGGSGAGLPYPLAALGADRGVRRRTGRPVEVRPPRLERHSSLRLPGALAAERVPPGALSRAAGALDAGGAAGPGLGPGGPRRRRRRSPHALRRLEPGVGLPRLPEA